VRWQHIIRDLEFVDAVVEFCQPGGRSLEDFKSHKPFLVFVMENPKEWPELSRWFMIPECAKMMAEANIKPKKPAWGKKDNRVKNGEKPPEIVEAEAQPKLEVLLKPKNKKEKQDELRGGLVFAGDAVVPAPARREPRRLDIYAIGANGGLAIDPNAANQGIPIPPAPEPGLVFRQAAAPAADWPELKPVQIARAPWIGDQQAPEAEDEDV
jgi:hypothetical protein